MLFHTFQYILESVEKHYHNGIELNFDTLYHVLRSLQESMNQSAAGLDVSAKWFFDRYSPVTQIKAVGHADVTYGHRPSLVDKSNSVMLFPPLKIQSYKSNKVLLLRSSLLVQIHQVLQVALRMDLFVMRVLQMRVVLPLYNQRKRKTW